MFGSERTKFLFRMGPRSGGETDLKLNLAAGQFFAPGKGTGSPKRERGVGVQARCVDNGAQSSGRQAARSDGFVVFPNSSLALPASMNRQYLPWTKQFLPGMIQRQRWPH